MPLLRKEQSTCNWEADVAHSANRIIGLISKLISVCGQVFPSSGRLKSHTNKLKYQTTKAGHDSLFLQGSTLCNVPELNCPWIMNSNFIIKGQKKEFFPAKTKVFRDVSYYQTSGYWIQDCVVRRKLKTILICEMPFFSAVSEKFSEQLSPKELHLKILEFFLDELRTSCTNCT
jgi:hypothetical protein